VTAAGLDGIIKKIDPGYQFTCFTGTKVHFLTPEALACQGLRCYSTCTLLTRKCVLALRSFRSISLMLSAYLKVCSRMLTYAQHTSDVC
jgi:hypothetical protein